MTNEEFQRIVIESLKELREGQKALESRQSALEEGQKDIYRLAKATQEQTAELTEFRTETNEKLDLLIEDNEVIKEMVGKHEVDIRIMQRKIERRIV